MAKSKKTTEKPVEKEVPVIIEEKVILKDEIIEPEESTLKVGDYPIMDEMISKSIVIIESPKLTVVFPYLHSMAQGDELLYAMRSLHANLRDEFQVVVIGDKLPWFSEEVICIETERISENPQIDTINKLQLAIADERVSDSFVWMNDDIYAISPIMLADIQTLTAYGKLEYIKGSTKLYDINRNKTIDLLKKVNLPDHNYDTHTPFFYEKEKLVELFELIPELGSDGLLVPSIYFNFHFRHFIPRQIDNINGDYMLRMVKPNTSKEVFDKFVAGKKFLNNAESGYNEVLLNFLKIKFAVKSRFEI